MVRAKLLILLGIGLNLWLGIGLSAGVRLAILEFQDYGMALAIVRCMIVAFVWLVLKLACFIGIEQISSISAKKRIWFFAIIIFLIIDIAMFSAVSASPNRFAAMFGEPWVMH